MSFMNTVIVMRWRLKGEDVEAAADKVSGGPVCRKGKWQVQRP